MKVKLFIRKRSNCFAGVFIADDMYSRTDILSDKSIEKEFWKAISFDEHLKGWWNFGSYADDCSFYMSENDVFEIIMRYDYYLNNNITIMLPNGISHKSILKRTASIKQDGKISSYISYDGEPLSKEDYINLTNNMSKFVLLNGNWVYANPDILSKYYENENDMCDFIENSSEDDIIEIEKPVYDNKFILKETNGFKNHQVDAIENILTSFNNNINILLADDMGLGKTATSIGVVGNSKSELPNLVIVPKSVYGNWFVEFAKFAPNVNVREFSQNPVNGVTYIATYGEILNRPCNSKFGIVVIDEAQIIKNKSSQISKAVCSINSEHRLAMTGTPIENSIRDLESIFRFINTNVANAIHMSSMICGESGNEMIVKLLEPYIIRRMKSDIKDINMPEKNEITINIEMSDYEKSLYNSILDSFSREKCIFSSTTILKYLTRLKLCCGTPKAIFNTKIESSKLCAVKELIKKSNYEPFVIFTQFRDSAVDILKKISELYGKHGAMIDGTMSAKQRTEIANRFQNGQYPFIVLTLKSGNCGLTLTKACNLIHYDRWWNPAVEKQATDRIYRIGQRNNVKIYKLVCNGTIEERIGDILEEKEILFDSIVNKFNVKIQENERN